jgi:hypothetical protein
VAPRDRPLGRRRPRDWRHVERYRATVATVAEPVNRTLTLPSWHWEHDQGSEGACVGFGCSMMMALLNRRRYEPFDLYREAQEVDEWDDTPPGEGTSVRAACDVLRDKGHVRLYRGRLYDWNLAEGISVNRWAITVDEMRAALGAGIPVTIGVNWYARFDTPQRKSGYDWMALEGDELGRLRGGHAVCVYGASDTRQAFRVKNSWGREYPLVWLPYTVMQRLLDEDGEATLVTDR